MGVTFPTINRWERQKAKPSPMARRRLFEVLKQMGKDGEDLLEKYFPAS